MSDSGLLQPINSQQAYDDIVKQISDRLGYSKQLHDLFHLQMAARIHAPKVQAQSQYYQEYIQPLNTKNCPSFFIGNNTIFCNLESVQYSESVEFLEFDHVFNPGSAKNIIFYADLLDSSFKSLLKDVIKVAETLGISLRLRYKPKETSEPVSLAGFGVELAIKSTEYKVIDDRDVVQTLKLEDEEPQLQKLDDAEISELSFRFASFLLNSTDALQDFAKFTGDFPKYAKFITQIPVESGFTSSNEPLMAINGLSVDLSQFSAFSTIQLITKQSMVISEICKLGFNNSQAIELTMQSLNQPDLSFDYRSDSIFWFNNVEKDSRYQQMSDSLKMILRPVYPGQLIAIRRNIFNVFFSIDFSNKEHLGYLNSVFEFIQGNVPIRFGMVPILKSMEKTSLDYQYAFCFYYITTEFKIKKIKEFIVELGKSSLTGAFQSVAGISIEQAMNSTTITSKLMELVEYIKILNVEQSPVMCFNGKCIDLTPEYQQELLKMYYSNLEQVQKDVYYSKIDDSVDFEEYWLSSSIKTRNPLIIESTARYFNIEEFIKVQPDLQTILIGDLNQIEEYGPLVQSVDPNALLVPTTQDCDLHESKQHLCRIATKLVGKGQLALFVNARMYGPFDQGFFTKQELELVVNQSQEAFEGTSSLTRSKLLVLIDELNNVKPISSPWKVAETNRAFLKDSFSETRSIEVGSNDPKVLVEVAIDPLTSQAQRIAGFLNSIKHLADLKIVVYLTPSKSKNLSRFYRWILPQKLTIEKGFVKRNYAEFKQLPKDTLLTLGMDAVSRWIVVPIESVFDLDNIKTGNTVESTFQLKYLLVEGHAKDQQDEPPRGAQFVLGTPTVPQQSDTITMANYGYLQLKASAGVYQLKLRPGRTRDIYELLPNASGFFAKSKKSPVDSVMVVQSSWDGSVVFPRLLKRAGMEKEQVLGPDSMWDTIKKMVSPQKTINIFSVASGHLYERFLSIMCLSVVSKTSSPVKFWFIENFLSPSFKNFVPHLAKEYKFEYEFVTYQWPHWLRAQTEKQRIIWGYKILFLDVLFPLSLEKVIFVDADQVVRADLKELVDLDLKGAAYGYTPFCDSRPEMDQFRFWKGGYWERHLKGRPYHISALYVVDLNKFRQIAAGDRLRGEYHGLSADPNSLANLDQDLPNNMLHEIPMFSLPQDWLWCETWCSDESLKTAKTIDLCNNPLTKEPKLERARRILPEWDSLDKKARLLQEKIKGHDEL